MGSSAVRSSWVLAFVAFPASLTLAQKTPDVRLDVGDPPGASASINPVIASSGTSVFVAWEDYRNDQEIFFNRSLDGGFRWLSPDVLLDAPGAALDAHNPAIAAEGRSVYVAWQGRGRGGTWDIYFNRSLDAGSTWFPAATRIDVGDPLGEESSENPAIAAQGSIVYVVWVDDRAPGGGIYLNRSLDRGATWLPSAVRVNSGLTCARTDSLDFRATSSALHVVWAEDCGVETSQVFYSRSEDDGLTWLPTPIRLDQVPPATFAVFPRIVACGSSLYVVWYDSRERLYFNRSLDSGMNWLVSSVPLETGAGIQFPGTHQIACVDQAVHVVWVRPGSIYYQRSLDQGSSWLPTATHLDPGGGGQAECPEMVVEDATVQVVWNDFRGQGPRGVFTNRSLDTGSTWLPITPQVDSIPFASFFVGAVYQQIARSGSSSYVSWGDNRDGEFDIYFTLALGYQAYGEGTPGSGGILPTIAGSGTASIGGTAAVDVANALGGAPCALVFTLAGPASIPSKFGTLLLQPPWTSIGVALGGSPGVPGAGAASISSAIPNDLALLGQRVNFQAGVIDVGAPKGIALSNGLELWIL